MEALLKVVVIMTERYGKVLKRGKADRHKLLFRSLAVFDRGLTSSYDQPRAEGQVSGQDEKPGSPVTASAETGSATIGFSVDRPGSDDDEDEDDDELALAALESLDAIEVFKQDHRTDTKIHHARIPSDGFQSKNAQPKAPDCEIVDHNCRADHVITRDCASESSGASRTTCRTADRDQCHRFTKSG